MTELERVYSQDGAGNWGWSTEVEVGGGGSQPGGLRVIPFSVDAIDTIPEPVLLFDPGAGERLLKVVATDFTNINETGLALIVATATGPGLLGLSLDETVGLRAKSSGIRNVNGAWSNAVWLAWADAAALSLHGNATADVYIDEPVYCGIAENVGNFPAYFGMVAGSWQPAHTYGADQEAGVPFNVVEAGSLWYNGGLSGVSGLISPDFAGGTPPLVDGDNIVWSMQATLPSEGSLIGYLIVAAAL